MLTPIVSSSALTVVTYKQTMRRRRREIGVKEWVNYKSLKTSSRVSSCNITIKKLNMMMMMMIVIRLKRTRREVSQNMNLKEKTGKLKKISWRISINLTLFPDPKSSWHIINKQELIGTKNQI